MSKVIFKYELYVGETNLSLPNGAKVLKAGYNPGSNRPVIWVLQDEIFNNDTSESRTFTFFGTGHSIHEGDKKLVYIDTVQISIGVNLVWHIFEIKE